MLAVAMMVSYQTAGKAARDAVFLTNYEISQLPAMVIAAAIATIILSLLSARWISQFGPALMVSRAFAISGLLQFIEWLALPLAPRLVAPLVYLHIAALTAILASGFWSILSEEIQLREAKLLFARIATWGTVGGILGGLAAERAAAWFGTNSVLLQLSLVHLVCAALLWQFVPSTATSSVEQDESLSSLSPWESFSRVPYLGTLALLILLGTASAASLDFLFKSQAREVLGKGPELLRFLALFHTASAVATILLQWVLSRIHPDRLSLTLLTASVPTVVGLGSIASALLPGLPVISITRLLEASTRASSFRNGYELFYSPIAPKKKRAVKTFIDVVCDRLGDASSSVIVQTALMAAPTAARYVILTTTVALSAVCMWLSARLDKGYQDVVELGLLNRADELGVAPPEEYSVVTSAVKNLSAPAVERQANSATVPLFADPILDVLCNLRSARFDRITTALRTLRDGPLDPNLVPALITLLGRDDSAEAARHILATQAAAYTGLMIDFLTNPASDFAVRRRLPRILAVHCSPLVGNGLLAALKDDQFEVRFQCSRALDSVRRKLPEFPIPPAAIYAAVMREVSVNQRIWDSRRLLDQRDADSTDEFSFLDDVLRERAHQSLEHVFTLLALVLPREPVRTAFRALHSGDRRLSDLALEYLERAVPAEVRRTLWPVLDARNSNIPDDVRTQAVRDILLTEQGLRLALKRIDDSEDSTRS